ncbi:MAG: sulfur carrier protein ThiS adenylyltransferase ThiF [bacterium]|nr:sulfur carrier protein ThiS adenylyltransferase ThiF [bacterium]
MRNAPGSYKRLSKATVGIAGAGGLGSNVAHLLARAGVGRLIIDDPDRIELSNLGRQLYSIDQVGKPKVEVLKESLKNINPFIKIEIYKVKLDESNISTVFIGVDLLIEALDSREGKRRLVKGFSKTYPEIPIIMASGLGGYGNNNKIKTRRVNDYIWVIGDFKTGPEHGLMTPRVCLVAAAQANLAVELLIEGPEVESINPLRSVPIVGGG